MLAGRVGEAIQVTQQLYPGLLEHNPNLLFVLKLVNMILKVVHNKCCCVAIEFHSAESLLAADVSVAVTPVCFNLKVSSVCGDGEWHGW